MDRAHTEFHPYLATGGSLTSEEIASADLSVPLTEEAFGKITIAKNGIPREIIEACRSSLIDSAKKGIRLVDGPVVSDFLRSEQYTEERYYELIRSTPMAESGLRFLE